jgi:hypothetical protein
MQQQQQLAVSLRPLLLVALRPLLPYPAPFQACHLSCCWEQQPQHEHHPHMLLGLLHLAEQQQQQQQQQEEGMSAAVQVFRHLQEVAWWSVMR